MNKKALVVDDHPVIRVFLKDYMVSLGFCVCTANNTDEAVNIIACNKYDVIILDLGLPGEILPEDVIEEVDRLSNDSVKIIYSARESDFIRCIAMRHGYSCYLLKDEDPDQVRKQICGAIEGEKYIKVDPAIARMINSLSKKDIKTIHAFKDNDSIQAAADSLKITRDGFYARVASIKRCIKAKSRRKDEIMQAAKRLGIIE
jgi:DNA-binding NarL/FixJ family response regulator